MATTPTITVRATDDVQTAATTRYLDREGIDYTVAPAEALTINLVSPDGTTDTWTGFQPDRRRQAIARLKQVAA